MEMKYDREPDLSIMLSPRPSQSSVDYVISSIKELLLTKKWCPVISFRLKWNWPNYCRSAGAPSGRL